MYIFNFKKYEQCWFLVILRIQKKNQPRKDCQNHIIGEQKLATYPKDQIHQK